MANTRELSQLASLINVIDASKSIGVVTSIPDAKVGVGTAVPTSRVHVDGDAYVTGVVTATSFSFATSGINSVFSTTDIPAWVYTNKLKSVTTDDGTPTGVYIGAAGTAMFIVGSTNDRVFQYTLSTPYDVSTAGAAVTFFSTTTQETNPLGIDFNSTGTKMFVVGNTGVAPLTASADYVHEYSLSTAWNVSPSSVGYTTSYNVTQDTTPQGVVFGNDGFKMYVVGSTNDVIYQYSLSTPYSLASGVTYDSISLNVGTLANVLETTPTDITFNSTGTVLWLVGNANDRIYEFRLGTAWDISTAVFYDDVYIGFNDLTIQGIQVIPEQNVAYIVGQTNDIVYQYSTNTPSIEIASSGISTNSSIVLNNETRVKDKLYVKGLAHFDTNVVTQGTLTVDSNLTVSGGTITAGNVATALLSGNTTTGITLGQSQTTGTLTVGGASQTGAITLGQATTAQTLNLATGVSAASTTKTINVGTGGASGSNTVINVGPTAGVGTVFINAGTNLGIGSATPTSKLDVVGDGKFTGIITATTFSGQVNSGVGTITTFSTTNLTSTNINASGIITAAGGFNIGIQSGGISVTTGVVTALNFIGAGNTFNYNSSTKTVDISISGGSAGVVTSVIAGSGVSVTQSAGIVTVSVARSGDIRVLDDISGSFNGVTTSFAITSSNGALTPANSQSLIVSIGGVIQKPATDYYVSANNLIFTSAPESNFSFFGIYFDLNLLGSNGRIDIIDDISGSFNGVTTSFAITSSGGAVSPNNAQALIVNLGGVIQSPNTNYTISGSNIVFATAPSSGLSFSAVHFNVYSADNTVLPRMLSLGGPWWSTTGNLGVGTTNPTSKLSVVGDVSITGIATADKFNSPSDIRLKENVQTIENAVEKVCQLRGVKFDWKKNGTTSYGVIAQELETVLPELVNGKEPKTVNYDGIIGVLIEAIKEQEIKIKELEKRINN